MRTLTQMGQSNKVLARNYTDDMDNPAGGYATGPGMTIAWQDGPRGTNPDGTLAPATGAFVEDALVAAHQRLAFFQGSEYACEENEAATELIRKAITILETRAKARAARGVLGQNVV